MNTFDMILLKGKPKTADITSFTQDIKGVWWVKFHNGKIFPYKGQDLKVLSSPIEIDINSCHIANKQGACFHPIHIWLFSYLYNKYYRIEFEKDNIREYTSDYLKVERSVLVDRNALNIFNYLKDVSNVNKIEIEGKDKKISLYEKYIKINFVSEDCAMASFLKPSLLKTRTGMDGYLFPFRSNRSQIDAVKKAFENQISIIQGPPGTGKTQTILNIIANIVSQGKTVLVVSNNNSAVENIFDKLQEEGLDFLVATLGKEDNKDKFISEGQSSYPDMSTWRIEDSKQICQQINTITESLSNIFKNQELLAQNRLEYSAIEIEKNHFFKENNYNLSRLDNLKSTNSASLMKLWIQIDGYNEKSISKGTSFIHKIIQSIHKYFLKNKIRQVLGIKNNEFNQEFLTDIKALYYIVKKEELKQDINVIESYLKNKKADKLCRQQAELSMDILKHCLSIKYKGGNIKRKIFNSEDLYKKGEEIAQEYPIVLSTTFSSRSSLPNYTFNYLIMDEASQVPIDSAALALSVAHNAIIVGDTQQLPNIIDNKTKLKVVEINEKYQIDTKYNYLKNSFLSSISKALPLAPKTILREHYRCDPMIINYCNQKFYGGNLIIMTKPQSEESVMKVVKTVQGTLAKEISYGEKEKIDIINQREVDEFLHLLDKVDGQNKKDIGVITPYRGQVKLFKKSVSQKNIEVNTIHKFQGREKDIIVMSTVVNHYNAFSDNSNLINVAVSRAKKHFVLITNGNKNPENTNTGDLIDYIQYNNGKIVESNLHSIFDLLYTSYADQRIRYLKGKAKISEYDSENITYNVLLAILKEKKDWTNLKIIPHYPLHELIRNTNLLDDKQKHFTASSWAHVDFLIFNRVSNRPVLIIEVDGFTYHHEGTKQAERDKIKDSILKIYQLPSLRLETTGSDETAKIREKLFEILPQKNEVCE